MSSAPGQKAISPEQASELFEHFRELKHSANNVLAVFLALAELSERNPANYERLAKAIMERAPQLVAGLQSFQEKFSEHIEA
jgi:hypothetical protein